LFIIAFLDAFVFVFAGGWGYTKVFLNSVDVDTTADTSLACGEKSLAAGGSLYLSI
jgi:hypothetical protein